jgi:hypothetical protein
MKTNDPWKRLTVLARRRAELPPPPTEPMPLGFETRVLARWRVPRNNSTAETWARLAWRAVPLGATALAVCWLALPAQPTTEYATDDVVEQLMQEVLNP